VELRVIVLDLSSWLRCSWVITHSQTVIRPALDVGASK
jgi:hypothetical protein